MSSRPPETYEAEEIAAATFASSMTASFAAVLEAFDEPAWLVSRTGAMLFANESARSLGTMPEEVAARARLTGRSWSSRRAQEASDGTRGASDESRVAKRVTPRSRDRRHESSARWRALRATSIEGTSTAVVLVTARSAASMRPSSPPPSHEPATSAQAASTSHEAWGLPPSLADVARLLVHGFSSREIAAATGYSLATVRVYSQRIYARLDVHSRLELVAWAQSARPRVAARAAQVAGRNA